jgi:hypothetical protein
MTDTESQQGDPAPTLALAEAQKIEARLLWAERMESLAALTAGLTHSFSNLLAANLMSVDLVLRANTAGSHSQLLTSLQAMTREGLETVRQLMWIARGVEGKPVVFQASYLLVEMQRLLSAFMPSVPIVTDYPDDLWALEGDPHRFVQLVLAICLEAKRGLPAGAAVILSAANVEPAATAAAGGASPASAARHVAIQVEVQQRQGLPPAAAAAKGERTPAAPAAPSHLPGLWLLERPRCPAAALAAAAGGSFEELSPPAGRGARILLPAAAQSTNPAAPAGEPARGDGARIVICEDAPLLSQALCEVLLSHGYQAVVAPQSEPRLWSPPRPPGEDGEREAGEGIDPPAGSPGDILLAAASLDPAGLWLLSPVATQAVPVVLMIDAATAHRLEREAPDRHRGFTPAAILRKPFTARELLFALASSGRRAT